MPKNGCRYFLPEYSINYELYKDIAKELPAHKGYFNSSLKGYLGLVARGNWGDIGDPNRDLHRKLQWFEVEINSKVFLIMNTHLRHRPEGKRDDEKRFLQSKIIIDFMEMFDCPKILMGDFNLLPDTESIKVIEDSGMRNLIKEYKIISTRTELYKNL